MKFCNEQPGTDNIELGHGPVASQSSKCRSTDNELPPVMNYSQLCRSFKYYDLFYFVRIRIPHFIDIQDSPDGLYVLFRFMV